MLWKHILDIDGDRNIWVMESVITSEPSDEDVKRPVYSVKWMDSLDKETTWEMYDNLVEDDSKLLEH